MRKKHDFFWLKEEDHCISVGFICLILFVCPIFKWAHRIAISFMPQYILILKVSLIIWIIVIFKLAFFILKQYLFIKNTPISKVNSAAKGYVTVEGIVSVLPDTSLLSPISQSPCAWYYYKIEEKKSIFRTNRRWSIFDIIYWLIFRKTAYANKNSEWEFIEEKISDQQFILMDADGKCFVDPDNANVITNVKNIWYSDTKLSNNISNKQAIDGHYRYTEKLLLPQQRAYISGVLRSIGAPKIFEQNNVQHAEVLNLLKTWKKDYQELLIKFDTNKDGLIDSTEWDQAVQTAEQEISEKYHNNGLKSNIINIISKQGLLFNQPFIISVTNKALVTENLNIKFFIYILLLIVVILVLLSLDDWYIDFIHIFIK